MERYFIVLRINAFLIKATSRNLQFHWTAEHLQNTDRDEDTIRELPLRDNFP